MDGSGGAVVPQHTVVQNQIVSEVKHSVILVVAVRPVSEFLVTHEADAKFR